ncbi:docking protein 1-like [Palaemon carinicauda]|uniref:docking protein 1-like n=1 Tax=Palaemon carinicauda TaxID=392227 RepID=UPI0035B682F9
MAQASIPVENSLGQVKSGDIYFRNKNNVIKKFKKHYVVLYATASNGVARLEVYDNRKSYNAGSSYCFLIPGSEVVAVKNTYRPTSHSSEEHQFGFSISTKETLHQFYTTDREDFHDWLRKLGKTLISQTNSQQRKTNVTLENDVYESADSFLREFPVTVGVTVRQKFGVDGEVRLLVESGFITLISMEGNRIARWAIEHLRRFGYTDNNFHLEAGRKSDHGEGNFVFITNQGKQIHTLVNKQKNYVRDKDKNLQPGLVRLNVDDCEIPMTTGGHVYVEIPVHPQNSTIPKSPPAKPVRVQQSKTRHKSSGGGVPPKVPTAGKPVEALTDLETLPRVKSQSTKPQPKLIGEQKVPNANPQASVYCETVDFKEAWISHGREAEPPYENLIYERDEEGGEYDNLEYFKRKIVYEDIAFPHPPGSQGNGKDQEKNVSASKAIYSTVVDPANNDKSGIKRNENAQVVKPSEPIYAQIIKPKKNKPKEATE